MNKKGEHTWDLFLSYQQCPKCGFIFENRKGYEPRFSEWVMPLICPRCETAFERYWKKTKE